MTTMTYTMNWGDFQKNMVKCYIKWRKDDEFTDVTLVSGDGTLHKAHQIILSSGSGVFMNILQNSKHPQPLIFLKGMKDHNLEAILDYIYFGEATIPQDTIREFFSEAQEYKLNGIADIIEEMVAESINNGGNNEGKNERNTLVQEIMDKTFKVNKYQLFSPVLAPIVIEKNNVNNSFEDLESSEFESVSAKNIEDAINEPVRENCSKIALQPLSDEQKTKRNYYKFLSEEKKTKKRENVRKWKASQNENRVQFEGHSEIDLKNTLNTMIGELGSNFFCKVCKKAPSTNKSIMEQHVKDFHVTGIELICNLWGKTLRSENALYTHKYRHHHKRN